MQGLINWGFGNAPSMCKDKIREELEKLSKEDLINIITELTNVYITSIVYRKAISEFNLQECICNVQTNIQEIDSRLKEELTTNFQKIR